MSLRPIPNLENKQDVTFFNQEIRKILHPGIIDHSEIINGKTFTWKNGVLVSIT